MTPITISKCSNGGYFVSQGDRVADRLGPDEALGVVAHALFGDGSVHRFLDTVEGWQEREVKHRKRTAAAIKHYATPPPITIVNAIDPEQIAQQLASPEGEKALLDVIGRNKDVISDLVDDWIDHDGSDCPVPEGAPMDVKLRCGYIARNTKAITGHCATPQQWRNGYKDGDEPHPLDIVAYRLHEQEPTGIDSEGGSHD